MTDFPHFRPENYPRTYEHKIELAVWGYIAAGVGAFFAAFCFLVVAFKYHGNLDPGGGCAALGVLSFAAIPIGLAMAKAPRLKLTADAIEYRDVTSIYVATRRMQRDEIKGVRTVYVTSPKGSSAGTTFMPKDEKSPPLFIPEYIFVLDDAYDSWVGSLPYVGGLYNCSPFRGVNPKQFFAEDFPRVEWREHTWRPRKDC